ncbi:uncharacterized protein LOC118200364 [Stegodyphus dumicola]|uniref:uncharacterized protein LOC118200364 n=1 Tax=Stegodyphus dumicola TaxID=202533 RepID=UPI0015B045BE|nr:uncharacterized protein LOC118200364 [Stegodyphus dumicola]XP_035228217.1 uncharacterized protein LOC118200364 [Stegodyphus dumicola]
MTRWARSGSTQKHKKMPGDATPWEEFSKQMKIHQNAGHSFKKKKKMESFIKKRENISSEDSNKHMSLQQNESENEFANATVQNSFVKRLEGDDDNKIMCKSSKRTRELDMSDFSPKKKKKMLKNKHDVNDFSADFIPVKHSESDAEENNDKKIYNNLKIIDGVAFASKKEFKKAMREEKIKDRISQKKLLKNNNMAENASDCGDTKTEKVTDRNGSYSCFHTKNPESISQGKHRQDANSNIHRIKSADGMTQLSKKQLKKEKRRKKLMNMRNQDSTSSQNVKEKISESMKIEKDLNQEECNAVSNNKTDVAGESNLKQGFKKVKNKKSKSSCQSSVDGKDLSTEEVNSKKVPEKRFTKMKESYLEKLQRKRAKNGILLLPAKIERKLYNIKRALRAKGMPPGVIKEIIRKERRKEELNFRKTSISKICFNCRKSGHLFADCPVKLGESDQGTGICFKCGSTEHTSYKCPKNISGFPLAKCFICSQQGHISKDCPHNKHGIYPKGGKCSICGNVNHLRKDCPTLSKKNEEDTVTLHTISEWTSIDAEPVQDVKIPEKPNKKPKVVKFLI